jgi:hypothetical protein
MLLCIEREQEQSSMWQPYQNRISWNFMKWWNFMKLKMVKFHKILKETFHEISWHFDGIFFSWKKVSWNFIKNFMTSWNDFRQERFCGAGSEVCCGWGEVTCVEEGVRVHVLRWGWGYLCRSGVEGGCNCVEVGLRLHVLRWGWGCM